jgi:hypothetical protein
MLVDMLEDGLGHRVVAEAGSVLGGMSLAENTKFDLAVTSTSAAGTSCRSRLLLRNGVCRSSL